MDVADWLKSLGLGQYLVLFREHAIDAEVLPELTDADLEKFGVPFGHRKRLIKAIANLGAAQPEPAKAAPPAPATLLADASAERRHLTVMFCDLVGSTTISAALDAEDWRNLVSAYLDAASEAVTQMGGRVAKKLGDGLMALFGHPIAQEDDSERAVRAALAIQRALADLNRRNAGAGTPQLVARIGVESGAVVVDAAGEIFGDAPNVAARVQALAEPGSVVVTARVQRQTAGLFVAEDRGAHALKGAPEPTKLFRIVRASGGRRLGARVLTPLVGREEELEILHRRWERAARGEGQFVQIVGEPGIGKSRLVEEFRSKLGEAPHTFVEWSSSQLLQNTPLHPIAEWGRQRFGAEAPGEQRLADLENTLQLIGLDPAEYASLLAPLVEIPLPKEREAKLAPKELRRRQLAALIAWVLAGARSQPLVLAFEDLHWADPTSLDLMQALAERSAQAPLFIIATARPEFRPPWRLRPHHSVISLSPLDRADVAQMVGELAARHALSQEVVDGVSERTGGVPLFVEEVTRLLLERGEEGGAHAIPPTLQQSLAARLDRLGEAREIAQIGAVLGRDFTYALLRDVATAAAVADRGHSEAALRAALDRLAEADLLFVEGHAPDSTYRFKHALIQDAAYESLLKSRRQALHRRAAEALVAAPDPQPELVAHHYTQAGETEPAIEWWGKAGDAALHRSAFQEAIAHLGRAIAMADKAAGASGRRARLQVAYGNALFAARGQAAPETTEAFAKAREALADDTEASDRLAADFGLWNGSFVRGELPSMRARAEALLSDIAERPDSPAAGVAHRIAGITHWFAGEFIDAKQHLERALALFEPGRDDEFAFRLGHDAGIPAMAYLAHTCWALGEVDRTILLMERMRTRMAELRHAGSLALGRMMSAGFHLMRGEGAQAAPDVFELSRLVREHELSHYRPIAEFLEGRVDEASGAAGGLAAMRRGAESMRQQKSPLFDGLNKIALAEAEARAGDVDCALALLHEGLATCERTGHRTFEAELHRARGGVLLKRDPANPAPAEQAYLSAIAVAQQHGARHFELRAALSLAKLYQSTSRPADAHAVVAPALEGFAPTAETPQIAEAQALLAALAASDEVKAEAARRHQRQQLHVAYGNALIAARGYAAPETAEAFAAARESADGDSVSPERLAADYGLWASTWVGGDLPSARAHAAAFLRDVEAKPDSPEACVAHRTMGLCHWSAGEFLEARDHLERALALFQPGRDDDLAFRFGQDAGVAAMIYLALTLWPLGEVERSESLVDGAEARAAGLAHVQTHAYANLHTAIFEFMRGGDASRTGSNAPELMRIARDYDLDHWRMYGVFLEGWMHAERGAPADGLADMRQGLELLCRLNELVFVPLLMLVLSRAEEKAADLDRAAATLDEALARSERTGQRAFDSELHRVRGEMLLRREPANPALAEEAFQAAIAIAKRQTARSFGLRAALPLAKLYQSTGRPAEAHAVLAPALAGFSPTPEMPEIAEAQTLRAALAETEEVKAGAAERRRRLDLQTSYGQALQLGKGFAAEETEAAFARVAELAGQEENPAARSAAFYAQCVSNYYRGEYPLAREIAETFLREAEADGRATEAGTARRLLAIVLFLQGDLKTARSLFQRALAEFVPERDGDARRLDGQATATAILASLAWHLGEVDRARLLIQQAIRRARELGHPATLVNALCWNAYLEIRRGDAVATRLAADAMIKLAEEHGMNLFASFGQMCACWASGRLVDPEAGASGLRQALQAYMAQGNRCETPLFHGMLADLEAATRGPDRALTLIDQGSTIAEETEGRLMEPYLHRLRGDILLKRDPADPAPAEDAYRTAIAIAKQQGARSYELLASLSLAKLYQSTGRPADAHAALAPALAGFSPTPEMPEIAEAEALLAALAGAHDAKGAAAPGGATESA